MKELYAKCLPFNKDIKGRIGGNPPVSLEDKIPSDYKFYATLVHPEKDDMMLSILIHDDFNVLLNNNIYPSIAIKVIEHEYSKLGKNVDKAIFELGLNSISEYTNNQEDPYLFIKVGGNPRLIQNKNFYYAKLEEDGYRFYLQIEEEGYSDDLDYVFMYGALYLYKHSVTGVIIAGFWQCS